LIDARALAVPASGKSSAAGKRHSDPTRAARRVTAASRRGNRETLLEVLEVLEDVMLDDMGNLLVENLGRRGNSVALCWL
jgi:hypothetical protein